MRFAVCLAAAAVSGCATSAAGLLETRVEKTVLSSKSAKDFATCVVENLSAKNELRSDGDHYWVLRYVMDVPRHRWDFTPVAGGSKAELRSSGLAGSGDDKVRDCA